MTTGASSRAVRSALALLALAAAAPAVAQVYAGVDENGVLHLSDRRPLGARVREIALSHAVDPLLVEALILAESGFDPRAVSPKGAAGLMQLMPATALRYGVADRFDPAQNVEGGVRYLRDLLALFDGDLGLALAAYNAGEDAVLRHGRRVPPYAESRVYVRRVTAIYDRLLHEQKRLPRDGAAAVARRD